VATPAQPVQTPAPTPSTVAATATVENESAPVPATPRPEFEQAREERKAARRASADESSRSRWQTNAAPTAKTPVQEEVTS
jgi:hypothetical protein